MGLEVETIHHTGAVIDTIYGRKIAVFSKFIKENGKDYSIYRLTGKEVGDIRRRLKNNTIVIRTHRDKNRVTKIVAKAILPNNLRFNQNNAASEKKLKSFIDSIKFVEPIYE